MEGGEIASHSGTYASRPVGVEFDDAARNDSVIGKKEFVIAVDGVEGERELAARCAWEDARRCARRAESRREECLLRSGIELRSERVRERWPGPTCRSLRSTLGAEP